MVLMCTAMLVACDREEIPPARGIGFMQLNLGLDVQNVGGRVEAIDTDTWTVIIYNQAQEVVVQWDDFSDVPSRIPLPEGIYTVFVSSEDNLVGFDAPYYEGTSDPFTIVKGDVVGVTVTAELANVKVTILYSSAVQADFSGWSTQVSSASGNLLFDKDELRSGYFPAGEALALSADLTFTKADNSTEVRNVSGTIPNTAGKDHYIVTVDYSLEDGEAVIGIVINDSTNDISIDLVPQLKGWRGYGGSDQDLGYTVIERSNGNFLIGGTTRSTDGDIPANAGHYDMIILEVDRSGNVVWSTTDGLGTVGIDRAYSIRNTPDGGFVVGGVYNRRFRILKFNSGNALEWSRHYGGNDEIGWDVEPLSDGTYVMTGRAGSISGDVSVNLGNYDCWTIRLDANGNLLWDLSIGGAVTDFGVDIDEASDGNYLVAGSSRPSSDQNFMLAKISTTGSQLWKQLYGGSGNDIAYSVVEVSDGYMVAGYVTSTDGQVTGNHGGADGWLIKTDLLGNLVWQKTYGGTGNDFFYSMEATDDGNFILGGALTVDGSYQEFWVLKVDANGNEIWSKTYGGSGQDQMQAIYPTQDGGYIGVGNITVADGHIDGGQGGQDIWAVLLDSQGNLQN